jgi:DNA polymerase III sliding clamp (beta) subunit (PCNA family)
VEQPCLDPRIGEMVRSLNLGKEGEKLFLEANISYEVLQHLTKDDLQVRLSHLSSHPALSDLSHQSASFSY